MTSIPVEDHTKSLTISEVNEKIEILSQESAKALTALSDNDQKIISQVKDALKEITSKVLYLSARLELFADLIEEILVKKEETAFYGDQPVNKLSFDQYRELVNKIKK